jgi:hypothetical protein
MHVPLTAPESGIMIPLEEPLPPPLPLPVPKGLAPPSTRRCAAKMQVNP